VTLPKESQSISADEILQGRLIEPVAFVDFDGAPGIAVGLEL